MLKIRSIIFVAMISCCARVGLSQAVPFFNGGAVASDPIIAVATDGVELNVGRATVSADRRYVTMDLNPRQTTLQGFRAFTFQSAGVGFVGGAGRKGGAGAVARDNGGSLTPSIKTSPASIGVSARPSVLDRPGMTMVAGAN